jgi:hypothetical protein
MAREAMEAQTEDRSRAAIAAVLAKGYHAKGDLVEGRKFLDQATRLGCKGRSYRRIRDLYETSLSSQ